MLKFKITLSLILLTSISLSNIYSIGGKEEAKSGDSVASMKAKELFVFGLDGDPTNNVNPMTASGRYDLMATKTMFSPLFVFNGPDDYEYYLATDISGSPDKRTYTVKLREDVRWHDGEDFTADDVVFTYKTIIAEPTANGHDVYQFDGNPMKVVKVDNYTVKFIFPIAIPFAMEILVTEKFMAPEHIWGEETEFKINEKNANPIGTGPYKFSKYREGESLTLVKNEDYFMGEPEIDTVIFRVVLDPNAAIVALKKGEIDALAIQPTDVEKFDQNSIDIYPFSENRIGYMSTILYRENMDNINFRKAILTAINKEDLIKATAVSEKYALNAHTFLPENASYFFDDVETYDYNPSKAKKFLVDSGIKNPMIKIAHIANNTTYETLALLIQANLADVGIDCELMPLDPGAMYNNALYPKTAEFDLFLGGFIMGIDPDNYATLFTTDGGSNFSGIKNETIDRLFSEGRVELDSVKRAQIYSELQSEFMDYSFFLPLTENTRVLAISKRIGGINKAKLVPIFTFEDMSKLVEVK